MTKLHHLIITNRYLNIESIFTLKTLMKSNVKIFSKIKKNWTVLKISCCMSKQKGSPPFLNNPLCPLVQPLHFYKEKKICRHPFLARLEEFNLPLCKVGFKLYYMRMLFGEVFHTVILAAIYLHKIYSFSELFIYKWKCLCNFI